MIHAPWWLLLLLLLPFLIWRSIARGNTSGVSISHTGFIAEMTPTLRQRLMWLPKALMFLALFFLVISLARPREGRQQTITESEGIAIQMVVDRSGSMQALDFMIDGDRVDRLRAIKNVASKFVLGDEGLDGRFNDLVGLITFAGYADSLTPPTLDHGFLTSSLNETEIVSLRREDGTAIGDAIALAVEKLTVLDENREDKIESKVIILLTDGENTAGELEPVAAAELAQTLGIKIYTIGVGTKGQAPIPVRDPFSGRQRIRMLPVNIDEATLKQVAEITDGSYFRAVDTDSLTEIYKEIDLLEKTNVETENFVDYRELAVQPYRVGSASGMPSINVWPTLLIAFVFSVASVVLQKSWLRETV